MPPRSSCQPQTVLLSAAEKDTWSLWKKARGGKGDALTFKKDTTSGCGHEIAVGVAFEGDGNRGKREKPEQMEEGKKGFDLSKCKKLKEENS